MKSLLKLFFCIFLINARSPKNFDEGDPHFALRYLDQNDPIYFGGDINFNIWLEDLICAGPYDNREFINFFINRRLSLRFIVEQFDIALGKNSHIARRQHVKIVSRLIMMKDFIDSDLKEKHRSICQAFRVQISLDS